MLVALVPLATTHRAAAPVPFASPVFGAVWSPVDEPVASGAVQRPYLWGAGPSSAEIFEPYRDAPGGTRLVQYFDKARMELTDPASGTVTTGLLTRELVTGHIQVGDSPAAIEVRGRGSTTAIVGDTTNAFPTYAQLRDWIDRPQPDATGQFVTDALFVPPGATAESTLAVQSGGMARAADDPNAQLVHFVPETGQTIPQAFWSFLLEGGPALDGGALVDRTPLFDWLSVVGLPISPAWWVTASVGGAPTAVMLQLYERRVLTYTPTNPAVFEVEMGNIGQHYFQYRYLSAGAPLLPVTVVPGAAATGKAPKSTTTRRATSAPVITGDGPVRIVALVARPPGGAADVNGETVTIRNDGLTTVDITQWTLSDASGLNVFTFPSLALPPGGMVVVHAGQGSPTATDLYFGKKKGIWKDTGDTATLRDASGAVVCTYAYR
ncbi:MAG: lamin tail domain-containing protein [Thermomicrobia bacterium]|nr:lamin tail domain-containing protein [Thermomicrobia bacterium]